MQAPVSDYCDVLGITAGFSQTTVWASRRSRLTNVLSVRRTAPRCVRRRRRRWSVTGSWPKPFYSRGGRSLSLAADRYFARREATIAVDAFRLIVPPPRTNAAGIEAVI